MFFGKTCGKVVGSPSRRLAQMADFFCLLNVKDSLRTCDLLLSLQPNTLIKMNNDDYNIMNSNNEVNHAANNEIILYQPDSTLSIDVRIEDETVWLTQAQMTELFQTTRNNITLHIRNIFKEGELNEASVCKESLLTAADGKRYRTKLYSSPLPAACVRHFSLFLHFFTSALQIIEIKVLFLHAYTSYVYAIGVSE